MRRCNKRACLSAAVLLDLQVPVIGFGENELFHMREVQPGSMRDKMQRFLKAAFGFTLPNAIGKGLFFGERVFLVCSGTCCGVSAGRQGHSFVSLGHYRL
jgi:hypothetical protein